MTKVTIEERNEGCITTVIHEDPLKMSESHHSTSAERILYAELATAKAQLAEWVRKADATRQPAAFYTEYSEGTMRAMQALLTDSRAELAAAREDTKRLDWLENNRSSGVGASRTKRLVGLSPDGTSVPEWKEWFGDTVREAIDAARAASKEGKQ